MGRCLPRCLVALALVLVAVVAVGSGSSASRPQAAVHGYAKLLAAQPGSAAAPADRTSDCLMATVLLRGRDGGAAAIPELQFEALRGYCRAANDLHAFSRSALAQEGRASSKTRL